MVNAAKRMVANDMFKDEESEHEEGKDLVTSNISTTDHEAIIQCHGIPGIAEEIRDMVFEAIIEYSKQEPYKMMVDALDILIESEDYRKKFLGDDHKAIRKHGFKLARKAMRTYRG